MRKTPLKILHIAPQNIANVPMTLVKAERRLGHYSRLVTFFADPRGYEEDVVLNLPFANNKWVVHFKPIFSHSSRQSVKNIIPQNPEKPPLWKSGGIIEKILISGREKLWQSRVKKLMQKIDFFSFDLYCFETGMDFFSDARTIIELKKRGKKIAVLYTGSDLRTRGIYPQVENAANFRGTFELDHLMLHPQLVHLPLPFDTGKFDFRVPLAGDKTRIGHAPTNREAKGSEQILAILDQLQKEKNITIVLIENMSHFDALAQKQSCDIFIDQIGDLGYGINSLEALAFGIPTCTCLAPGFHSHFPEHPFIEINAANLKEKLVQLIDNPNRRNQISEAGRKWVEKYHDSLVVVQKIHQLSGVAVAVET
ncbi:MAG: glycosyltransferase family 1 protein [Calditrichaeota bacterium]|nr:MAG: glycosyltransferase family 1 protein [Calditrichota bacterium]